jgi:hypothetical protein
MTIAAVTRDTYLLFVYSLYSSDANGGVLIPGHSDMLCYARTGRRAPVALFTSGPLDTLVAL